MADSALGILIREGERRGALGHIPNAQDFDEHVRFYKSALRIARLCLASIAVLLLGMFFFLVR